MIPLAYGINTILGLLLKLLITSISLFIISKLPIIGVEIDSFGKAVFSALVFGVLNALVAPFMWLIGLGPKVTDLLIAGPIHFVINVIIFALAAALVPGFKLTNKILDPILGAILLTLLNTAIHHFLPFSDAAKTALVVAGIG